MITCNPVGMDRQSPKKPGCMAGYRRAERLKYPAILNNHAGLYPPTIAIWGKSLFGGL
ncbi:hypothetical protein [Marisediminitalea sp.]|uniref:hypothetical protein n=1 Tax=Marisediminitalea sp. TaxID=2662268 RepID=UPI00351388E7